jgi:hypothetical protein
MHFLLHFFLLEDTMSHTMTIEQIRAIGEIMKMIVQHRQAVLNILNAALKAAKVDPSTVAVLFREANLLPNHGLKTAQWLEGQHRYLEITQRHIYLIALAMEADLVKLANELGQQLQNTAKTHLNLGQTALAILQSNEGSNEGSGVTHPRPRNLEQKNDLQKLGLAVRQNPQGFGQMLAQMVKAKKQSLQHFEHHLRREGNLRGAGNQISALLFSSHTDYRKGWRDELLLAAAGFFNSTPGELLKAFQATMQQPSQRVG